MNTKNVGCGVLDAPQSKRQARCYNRTAKRIVSLILSLAMLFTITAGFDFKAKAAVGDDFILYYDYTDRSHKYAVITDFEGDIEYLSIPDYVDDGVMVTTIGKEALISLRSLKMVQIPNTVSVISEAAFANCDNLEYVILSDNIIRIEEYAFSNCESLYRVLSNSSENWPEKLRNIHDGAFRGCKNLINFYAPNVENVQNAFDGCVSMTSVILPTSLKYISDNFYPCNESAFIGYEGTEEQWENVLTYGLHPEYIDKFNHSFCESYEEHEECWKNVGDLFFLYCSNCGEITYQLPFMDITAFKDDYFKYILYTSVYNEFIKGTNPPLYSDFSPKTPITRAMFVTILYRMAGEPYADNNRYKTSPFTDIKDTSVYYYDAACWALDNGITNQITFKPFDNVTREQTASFLFRYAKDSGTIGDEEYKNVDLSSYPDFRDVNDWAVEALQWSNYNGMITGTQQGFINPQGATQRIHATKILYGFGKVCNIGNFE